MNTAAVQTEHHNEVRLIGRLSTEPQVVLLPSGDEIVWARLVVQRPRPPAGQGTPRRVDTVTCTAWAAAQRRKLRILEEGDTVEITGALRRRFWRAARGQSIFEIEVESAQRIARRPPPPQKKRAVRKADPPPDADAARSERHLVLVGGEAAQG